jgi:hypothetical protein
MQRDFHSGMKLLNHFRFSKRSESSCDQELRLELDCLTSGQITVIGERIAKVGIGDCASHRGGGGTTELQKP